MARARVEESIARRWPSACLEAPTVWTPEALWAEVRLLSPDGLRLLPRAALRAVLVESVRSCRRAGELRAPANLIDTAGYRRTLAERIASWTRAGVGPEHVSSNDGSDAVAVYARYRAALDAVGGEDREGFARWAVGALPTVIERLLGPKRTVVLIDPCSGGLALLGTLPAFHESSKAMLVVLPGESLRLGEESKPHDPGRLAAFAEFEPLRTQLREWGFAESTPEFAATKPPGLAAIRRAAFRSEQIEAPEADAEGLLLLGAPRGEGVALVVARAIRERLEAGDSPEDILVAVPRWDQQADAIRETLRSWGLPASGGPGRPLSGEPAVTALRAAMALSGDGWESEGLGLLLRNGRFRPDWPEAPDLHSRAAAAAAIRDSRGFRGLEPIRRALRRDTAAAVVPADSRRSRRSGRARSALDLLDRLADLIEPLSSRPVPWFERVNQARALAASLCLELPEDGPPALDRLFAAAEDAGDLLTVGGSARPWTWPAFARELSAIALELPDDPEPIAPGSIRMATIADALAASARVVVIAGLEEGTFPDRDAVAALLTPTVSEELPGDESPSLPGLGADNEPDPAGTSAERLPAPLAREMRRFLAAVGLAEELLILVYPTTNEKGQALDPSGFLDDVKAVFEPEALAGRRLEIRRLDPILPADLAGSPAERRTRAVALACLRREPNELAALARLPEHVEALGGVAAAIRLSAERSRGTDVGPFDGMIGRPAAARKLAADFGPGRATFSASQLDTLALCPYKYFLKYILRLDASDDRDELDEDALTRGRLIHEALERLHVAIYASEPEAAGSLPDRVRAAIEPTLGQVLEARDEAGSDVEAGLRRIEEERLRRTARRYARQFDEYHQKLPGVTPVRFEDKFGQGDQPPLQIGDDASGIALQGIIDRIDLYERDGQLYFRIIDYKTGSPPSSDDVAAGVALQLPLYALAVQRVLFGATVGGPPEPLDLGYWGLKEGSGFRPALRPQKLDRKGMLAPGLDWPETSDRLETYVIDLVDRVRRAELPVMPRKDDCTRSCEYRTVCRIGQVRLAGKSWPAEPKLEGGD